MERVAAGIVDSWPEGLLSALPVGPWLVVHARPRQEKCLAAQLRNLGAPGVLFLQRRVRTYKGKGTQVSLVPLMPGYLFAPCGTGLRDVLYATGRVVRLIDVHYAEELCQDITDLAALVSRAESPLIVRPELQPGMRVELTRGSLAGMSGIVVRRKGRYEVVVNVRMLGTSVAVACAAEDIAAA
jgi:transcription antitermination factor NusG